MKKVLIAWMLAAAGAAQAQSFAAAQAKYQKGDYAGAEQAYALALKTEQDPADRLKLLKYLGICQYMRGAHKEAFLSFKQMIALNPASKISTIEVVDETVVSFFDRVKQLTMAQAAKQPAAASKAAAAKGPEAAKMDGSKSEPKKTLLVVSSNVPDASVMIEGIIAGKVNQPLNVDPGKLQIEVLALGWSSTQQVVDVAKDQQNKVFLKLEKPVAEKPVAEKPVADKHRSKAKDTAIVVKAVDMFGDEQPQKRRKVRVAANGQKPRRAQAAAKQRRTSRSNLAADFERDARALAPVPQQQVLPPPYYAAYPVMSQPMAMQNTAPSNHSSLLAILPFGAGQFQNGNPFLGSVFALAEAGALYMYFDRTKEANIAANERRDYLAGRDESTLAQEELDYLDNRDAHAKANKQQATIAAASFGGLWLVGAVEALLSGPDTRAVAQPGLMPASPYYYAPQQQAPTPRRAANDGAPRVSLAPVEAAPESSGPGWALQANWKF